MYVVFVVVVIVVVVVFFFCGYRMLKNYDYLFLCYLKKELKLLKIREKEFSV